MTIAALLLAALALSTATPGVRLRQSRRPGIRHRQPRGARGTEPGRLWAFTAFDAANWHPLTWLSHMADASLFGAAPGGHHLVNLGLHAACARLLFPLLRALTGALWPRAVGGDLRGAPAARGVRGLDRRAQDVLAALLGCSPCARTSGTFARPGTRSSRAVARCSPPGCSPSRCWSSCRCPAAARLVAPRALRPRRGHDGGGPPLVLEKAPLFASPCSRGSSPRGAVPGRRGRAARLPPPVRLGNALLSFAAYLGDVLLPRTHPLLPAPGRQPALGASGARLRSRWPPSPSRRCASRRVAPFATLGWLWFLIALVPVIGMVQVGQPGAPTATSTSR